MYVLKLSISLYKEQFSFSLSFFSKQHSISMFILTFKLLNLEEYV